MTDKIKTKASDRETLNELFKDQELSGYIWMVEEQYPTVYDKKIIDFTQLENKGKVYNKIQEAYLTDGEHSIHIKNIDGEEKVFVFAYTDFENDRYKLDKEECYPSHLENKKNIKNLCFQQVYELIPNEISEGFENWIPVVKLFKGINLKNESHATTK
jgi:CRISPR type III-associated protein (TIGR04423 family)